MSQLLLPEAHCYLNRRLYSTHHWPGGRSRFRIPSRVSVEGVSPWWGSSYEHRRMCYVWMSDSGVDIARSSIGILVLGRGGSDFCMASASTGAFLGKKLVDWADGSGPVLHPSSLCSCGYSRRQFSECYRAIILCTMRGPCHPRKEVCQNPREPERALPRLSGIFTDFFKPQWLGSALDVKFHDCRFRTWVRILVEVANVVSFPPPSSLCPLLSSPFCFRIVLTIGSLCICSLIPSPSLKALPHSQWGSLLPDKAYSPYWPPSLDPLASVSLLSDRITSLCHYCQLNPVIFKMTAWFLWLVSSHSGFSDLPSVTSLSLPELHEEVCLS